MSDFENKMTPDDIQANDIGYALHELEGAIHRLTETVSRSPAHKRQDMTEADRLLETQALLNNALFYVGARPDEEAA